MPSRSAAGGVHSFVSRPDLRPPVVDVLTRRSGTADGYIFLAPSSGPGRRGGMIIDGTGEPVFFHTTYPRTTMDFRPGIFKGAPVLTWWEGKYVVGVGRVGEYVMMDNSYREIARFSAGNGRRPDFHEVLLTDHGTLLVTAYETDSADLRKVGGPRAGKVYGGVVQELALPSGRVLWEWRSLEHVAIAETFQTQVGNPFDYFHINAIDVDTDGNLIVSARNTWAVYKIDRSTGEVIWRLGGRKSDFAMGRGTPFAFQHDARSHDGGRTITIFDNGPDPGQKKPQSRAMSIALDFKGKRATLARQIRHFPALYARVTGNHQVLPNGNCVRHLGQHRLVHRVRAERLRALRRQAADRRSELPGLPVPMGWEAGRSSGAGRVRIRRRTHALRELERGDRGGVVAGRRRGAGRQADEAGAGSEAGLRDEARAA